MKQGMILRFSGVMKKRAGKNVENTPHGDSAAVQLRMAPGEPLEPGEQALGAKLLSQGHGCVLVSWSLGLWMFGSLGQAQHGHSCPRHTWPVRAHQAGEVASILSRPWISDAARLEDPSSPKGAALQGAELCQLLVVADLHQFRQQLYTCLSPAHLWEPSVGPPAGTSPPPQTHPLLHPEWRGELMGNPFPAAFQNQQASRPPKRDVFLRDIRHCDANSAQKDENVNLEEGNVGMQLG